MTLQTLTLLRAMLEAPAAEYYGLELMRRAGLKSGTLYPVLARLERAGWLVSHWENVSAQDVRRPRRRLYALTGEGEFAARQALNASLEALTPPRTMLNWTPRLRPESG